MNAKAAPPKPKKIIFWITFRHYFGIPFIRFPPTSRKFFTLISSANRIREWSLFIAGGHGEGGIAFECKHLEDGGGGAKFQSTASEWGGAYFECTDI